MNFLIGSAKIIFIFYCGVFAHVFYECIVLDCKMKPKEEKSQKEDESENARLTAWALNEKGSSVFYYSNDNLFIFRPYKNKKLLKRVHCEKQKIEMEKRGN